MKISVKKMMAQRQIARIKKELEELDALDANMLNTPVPPRDETRAIMTTAKKRERLLAELAKYQKQLESE